MGTEKTVITSMVAFWGVVLGVLLYNVDTIPQSMEEVRFQIDVFRARMKFGASDGLCESRAGSDIRVSCAHRAIEEALLGHGNGRDGQYGVSEIHEIGFEAWMKKNQKEISDEEEASMEKAKRRFPDLQSYDKPVKLDWNRRTLFVSVVSPPQWTLKKGATSDRVIVYFHGGGYLFGSSHSDSEFRSLLASELGMMVISVNYTLASHSDTARNLTNGAEQAQLRDGRLLLQWLRDEIGVPWSQVILLGSEAGGGMAISLVHWLQRVVVDLDDSGRTDNVGMVVALSPWTDTCIRDGLMTEVLYSSTVEGGSCALSLGKPDSSKEAACLKTFESGCSNNHWSPVRSNYAGIRTRFLIWVADRGDGRQDGERMHQRLMDYGTRSDLVLFHSNIDSLPWMFPFSVAEGSDSVLKIIDWVRNE